MTPILPWTGERVVPYQTPQPTFLEHEIRYNFASNFVTGKIVLDVASGSGIGASFLSRSAKSVIGLEISDEALAFSRNAYPAVEFRKCDAGTTFPVETESIDLVVSFETLEHLHNQKSFFAECQRVLRRGGVFICSTPNRSVFRWHPVPPARKGAVPQPTGFHVKELTAKEFVEIAAEFFNVDKVFSQGVVCYPMHVARKCASKLAMYCGIRKSTSPGKVFLGEYRSVASGLQPYAPNLFFKPSFVVVTATKA